MEDVSRVDVLQTAQGLIDERLEMSVRERLLRTDLQGLQYQLWKQEVWVDTHDSVKICLHELFLYNDENLRYRFTSVLLT